MAVQTSEASAPPRQEAAARPAAAVAEARPVIAAADQTAITTAAAEGLKPGADGQRALKMIAMLQERRDARGQRALENSLKVLKESKDPADRALAIDFEIAQKKMQLMKVEATIAKYKKLLTADNLPTDKRQEYEAEVKQLESQRDGVSDAEGNVTQQGIVGEIAQMGVERAKLPADTPNAIYELAIRFGASAEAAGTDPLSAIQARLAEQAGNKKGDRAFSKQLKESGFSNNEEAEVANILRLMRGEPTRLEKTRNIAIKTGGVLSALMLLMAWLASKERQQGAMG